MPFMDEMMGEIMDRSGLMNEIASILRQDKLDSDDTQRMLRLILASQQALLEHQERAEKRIEKLEAYNKEFPSVFWFAVNQPKRAALYVFVILLGGMVLFAPVNISDLRHAILGWLGFSMP